MASLAPTKDVESAWRVWYAWNDDNRTCPSRDPDPRGTAPGPSPGGGQSQHGHERHPDRASHREPHGVSGRGAPPPSAGGVQEAEGQVMLPPERAARAFVGSLPSRPSGDLSHAVPVRTADLVPLLAALIQQERATVREACAAKCE